MIGNLLREWREQANLNQGEAQARMGWQSTGTVSAHETGRNIPSPELVRRYAEAYGRSHDDLIGALLFLAGGGIQEGTTDHASAAG